MESQKSLGVLGAGNMARALLSQNTLNVSVLNSTNESTQHAAQKIGAQSAQNIEDILNQDLLVLGVKPQRLGEILQNTEITKPIISLLAMTPCDKIREKLKTETSITRLMPTMGSLVQKGLTAIYFENDIPEEIRVVIREVCETTGAIIEFESEHLLEGFTIYSSSMMAIIALLQSEIEKHISSLEKQESLRMLINNFIIEQCSQDGFTDAKTILEKTNEGLEGLFASGKSAEEIIQLVASKGGTTEAMLNFLKIEKGVLEAFFHYPDIYEVQKKFFHVFKESIDIGLKKTGFA